VLERAPGPRHVVPLPRRRSSRSRQQRHRAPHHTLTSWTPRPWFAIAGEAPMQATPMAIAPTFVVAGSAHLTSLVFVHTGAHLECTCFGRETLGPNQSASRAVAERTNRLPALGRSHEGSGAPYPVDRLVFLQIARPTVVIATSPADHPPPVERLLDQLESLRSRLDEHLVIIHRQRVAPPCDMRRFPLTVRCHAQDNRLASIRSLSTGGTPNGSCGRELDIRGGHRSTFPPRSATPVLRVLAVPGALSRDTSRQSSTGLWTPRRAPHDIQHITAHTTTLDIGA
jgi:hypothetical protein